MKIGLIPAPLAISEGIDLLDVFSIEDTFDCPTFQGYVEQAKNTCEYSLVWVRGFGLFPLKYQTLPLTPNTNEHFSLSEEHIETALYEYLPQTNFNVIEYVNFGDIEYDQAE
ncbi:hypothetical protein OH460_08940 [Vibrio sp. Makdt]|uniref:hypothetical protein n=1 Tax=Vibrio sp. Makdt TaxID=2998828 RepID=UPI0022CDBA7A|nr:hypothetical protein [Vibrio sp. Makdt]MDA0152427.1 hypothetical protein [Vibrio sp. Makdt]